MNRPASPLISRTEDIYQLPGKLTELGYTSVFDVVRVPRERFIRKHRCTLGRRAEKMYDLAVGYAHQVAHHFRYKRVTRAVKSALRGPFSVPGPDYASQFLDAKTGWKDKVQSGALEANDAPVAYLTYIYELALQQEKDGASDLMNTLAERRPDLGALVVDDAAVNEVIPQLQLVNEILAKAIQDKKSLNDLEAVNALLATTRYPNTLPYHYGHQQIQAAQSVVDTTLQDITLAQTFALPQNFWETTAKLSSDTAVQLSRLQIMASQLAPEQQKIITEPAYFGHCHLLLSDLSDKAGANSMWIGPPMVDSLPYQRNFVSGAFILPLQDGVDEYDERPNKLIESGARGVSLLKIKLKNDRDEQIVTLQGRIFPYGYPYCAINSCVTGASSSPHAGNPHLVYEPEDNPDLKLSDGPWHGQFTLNFNGLYGGRHDLTLSLCLSEHDKVKYTPRQTNFYLNNYGDSSLSAGSFADMAALTARTGLTVPQIEQLLCVRVGGFTVTQSDNFVVPNELFSNGHSDYKTAAVPFLYGARFIHAGIPNAITLSKGVDGTLTLNNLTDDKLDRINRIVRLQKWLDLPYEEVDLLVTAAMDAEGDANRALLMNDNTLRMLGVFKHYQTTYGVSAKQFAAWLNMVTPFAITPDTPFLDQVFNASGAFDTPFVVDNQDFVYTLTTGDDGARVKHISTALGLNHAQFLLLAENIARQQGDASLCTLNCNLFVVSAFYRLATLARTLGTSPEDFCALLDQMDRGTGVVWKQLAGRPVIALPQQDAAIASDVLTLLQALSAIAQWQQERQLPSQTVQLLTTPINPNPPATGNYGTTSTSGNMSLLSIGWKDLTYDPTTGTLNLTQQIAFRIDKDAYAISEFHYALPDGLIRNGDLSWQGDALKAASFNPDYGQTSDRPFTWSDTWFYLDSAKTYVLNIPLKGTFEDLSALNALSSQVRIHTNAFNTTLNFSQGAILGGDTGFATQGTNDQLNFIQQVWQHLPSTFVDSTLLTRSGAPLADTDSKPIDWLALLSADGAKLIDADGFVTDQSIDDVVKTVVNAQALSDADKALAITALTNTLTQARQTQQGVAVSLLAKTLNVSQSFPSLLLRWTGQTPYQWLSTTWALKATVTTPADIPPAYLNGLRELVRRALLCQQFSLSPALVQQLLDHPDYFGMAAEGGTTVNLWTLYTLSRYSDLLTQVGASGGGTEDDVLAYLRAVNATPPLNDGDAASLLASLLGWERDEVFAARSVLGGVAKTTPQLDTVLRLQRAQRETGLSVSQQQQAFVLNRDSGYDDWQNIGQAMVTGATHVNGVH